jgi:hypothetical protein
MRNFHDILELRAKNNCPFLLPTGLLPTDFLTTDILTTEYCCLLTTLDAASLRRVCLLTLCQGRYIYSKRMKFRYSDL